MMNVLSSHPQNVQLRIHHDISQRPKCLAAGQLAVVDPSRKSTPSFRRAVVAVRAVIDGGGGESSSGKDDDEEEKPRKKEEVQQGGAAGMSSREELERLIGGPDDSSFNGLDLANLIRNKYGRSYDVTLIKKEFMGRNLLAMNVMWKYREQRSFPLTEEEYLLRLDDVANTLKCWGAVAHVRNTLEKVKDRPRIGKAVSIFIDMDQTGGRSNEWIYK